MSYYFFTPSSAADIEIAEQIIVSPAPSLLSGIPFSAPASSPSLILNPAELAGMVRDATAHAVMNATLTEAINDGLSEVATGTLNDLAYVIIRDEIETDAGTREFTETETGPFACKFATLGQPRDIAEDGRAVSRLVFRVDMDPAATASRNDYLRKADGTVYEVVDTNQGETDAPTLILWAVRQW
jgi:hypothetical protein